MLKSNDQDEVGSSEAVRDDTSRHSEGTLGSAQVEAVQNWSTLFVRSSPDNGRPVTWPDARRAKPAELREAGVWLGILTNDQSEIIALFAEKQSEAALVMVRQYMKLLPEEGFLIDESQREGIQAVLTALTKAPMTSGFQSVYSKSIFQSMCEAEGILVQQYDAALFGCMSAVPLVMAALTLIGEVYSVTDGVQLDATAQEYVVELVQAARSFGFIKLNNSPGTGERKNWTVYQIHQQPSGCYALAFTMFNEIMTQLSRLQDAVADEHYERVSELVEYVLGDQVQLEAWEEQVKQAVAGLMKMDRIGYQDDVTPTAEDVARTLHWYRTLLKVFATNKTISITVSGKTLQYFKKGFNMCTAFQQDPDQLPSLTTVANRMRHFLHIRRIQSPKDTQKGNLKSRLSVQARQKLQAAIQLMPTVDDPEEDADCREWK